MSKLKIYFWTGLVSAAFAANLGATPTVKLLTTSTPVINIAQGSNGTATVDVKNVGDGSLSLTATSTASWITATVGASHNCSDGSGPGCIPIQMALQTSSLAKGNYTAQVIVNDPNAVDAPQTIIINAQIGTGVPDKLDFTVIQGTSASTVFSTTGQTTNVASAPWLSVLQDGGSPFSQTLPYRVTADSSVGALAVGDSSGTVTVSQGSNAADNKTIPVTLHVVKQPLTGPIASIGGVRNNATFVAGESVAQGDIAAVFGSQFMTGAAQQNSTVPLPTTLNGIQVLLNGTAVPLYYVSANQINFQVPFNATVGTAKVQVVSNGTNGNLISVTIAKAVPRILVPGTPPYSDYGIITNADNSLAWPTALGASAGLTTNPAKIGGAIVMYTIGLGPTSPSVDSGAGSPGAEPLARVTSHVSVCFSAPTPFNPGVCVAPLYSGLAPGFVGLYQVNVVVPVGSPTGDKVPIYLQTDDGNTNSAAIAIQ